MQNNYYYDQTHADRRPGDVPGAYAPHARRRGRKPLVLFLCALVLIIGLSVTLAALQGGSADGLLTPPGGRGDANYILPEPTASPAPTTIERAPLGDGTTLLLYTAPEEAAHSFQEIYQENIGSIVSIRGQAAASTSLGTGVVLTENGYIITNAHVIEGCSTAEVVLQDERVYDALLVGMDQQSDLAVLKIEVVGLAPAVFGSSDQLQVGDPAIAIGNPLGEKLKGTMTEGIISAINRDVRVDDYTMSLIQTSAALNSGNSGGALINQFGQVVGITNLKMHSYYDTVEGLGFAIPTSTVKTVVDALIAQGYVGGRPTIGIVAYTLTEALAEEMNLPVGVYVDTVQDGSDAKHKGVKSGDVITAINGEAVTKMEDIARMKETAAAGDILHITVYRDGETYEFDVALVEQNDLKK